MIYLATANPKKAAELGSLLSGFDVLPRPDWIAEIDETMDSFEGNSVLKAQAIAEATSATAIADDSGLEVAALDDRPGVYSARYAGEFATDEENVAKLLEELDGSVNREAKFVCVITIAFPDGTFSSFPGETIGQIAYVSTGSGGFGYDPVFIPDDGDGRTFAEMGASEKASISHRGRAIAKLVDFLANSG